MIYIVYCLYICVRVCVCVCVRVSLCVRACVCMFEVTSAPNITHFDKSTNSVAKEKPLI